MKREDTKATRIETLKKTQFARKQDAIERVYKAIERLQKINAKINFQNIAREANLSVSYLYKYPELKQHIAELRSKQSAFPVAPVAQPNSTSTGKVIARLKNKIQQLEQDNKELKRKNEALAGQVYRAHQLQAQVERQQQTIEDLQARIKDEKNLSKVTPISSKRKSQVSESIQEELDNLGIKLNPTLTKKIISSTEEAVLNAIEALKEEVTKRDVESPGGFLNRAIDEGWTASGALLKQEQPLTEAKIFTAEDKPQKKLVSADKLKQLSNIFNQKND
jgi:hypothetical protein